MALTYTPEASLGEPCPDFNLKAMDERYYQLKDFKNKDVLVILFICNHCPYVKAIERSNDCPIKEVPQRICSIYRYLFQ